MSKRPSPHREEEQEDRVAPPPKRARRRRRRDTEDEDEDDDDEEEVDVFESLRSLQHRAGVAPLGIREGDMGIDFAPPAGRAARQKRRAGLPNEDEYYAGVGLIR